MIKDHNLLQTLTRVNRPYKKFRYGFVVDFADIRKEFDATNKAYFDELQLELGDEMQTYSNLFKSREEIEAEISDIKEKLFHYDLRNAELFSQQIIQIDAVLASAFALFFGNADAEANHCRHQSRQHNCRQSQPCNRVHVHPGCGIHGHGNYGVRNNSWNNSGQNYYGHGTHFNSGYRNGSCGCSY